MKQKLIIGALVGIVGLFGAYTFLLEHDSTKTYSQESSLFIPPLIDSRLANNDIEIVIQDTEHEFFPGVKSKTKGFDQSYLGPTVRFYKDETTRISFINDLEEPTTVHGHGLHIDGEVDGGPQGRIFPGETRSVDLDIVQQAGTSWYHPHFMATTAEQVHAGLAGFYLIEDENSLALPLPKEYGVNDIPLIVQDRTFVDGRMKHYAVDNDQIMDGLREETLVVNGVINPHHDAPDGWIRLRLLNGSNARFYRFFFAEPVDFYKIATEGGFLNTPVAIKDLTMAPGERNEIMVNLSGHDSLNLMAEFLSADPEGIDMENAENIAEYIESLGTLFTPELPVQRVLQLRTDKTLVAEGELPSVLNDIDYDHQDDINAAVKRNIQLDMDMADDNGPIGPDNMFSINGAPMEMDVINERVKRGDMELWTITAEMMPHPFHIHGVSFKIITHNGKPPAESDRGWKDTLIVTTEPSQVLMQFNHLATDEFPYMYHCHILEHEDFGMMGQFTVSNF